MDSDFYGCRWGEQTRFAVIDIDTTSEYHCELGLARLRESLSEIGLDKQVLYRSSDSGGWHLYLFFDGWEQSGEVNRGLKEWLRAKSFVIKAGQLELFPSGNGLRLPLQAGFAWLTRTGELKTRREELATGEAIGKFLQDLDENQNNWQAA